MSWLSASQGQVAASTRWCFFQNFQLKWMLWPKSLLYLCRVLMAWENMRKAREEIKLDVYWMVWEKGLFRRGCLFTCKDSGVPLDQVILGSFQALGPQGKWEHFWCHSQAVGYFRVTLMVLRSDSIVTGKILFPLWKSGCLSIKSRDTRFHN